jgi:hypothetical protein
MEKTATLPTAQNKIAQTIERFAEQSAARATRYLIVDGRVAVFSIRFPQIAARVRIQPRFPKIKPGRAGGRVVNRSLIRVPDLIDDKIILINNPISMRHVFPSAAKRRVERIFFRKN